MHYYQKHLIKYGTYSKFESEKIVIDQTSLILDFLGGNRDHIDTLFFNRKAISHLRDVKKIFTFLILFLKIVIILAILTLTIIIIRKRYYMIGKAFFIGGVISLLTLIVIMVIQYYFWEEAFSFLHTVFFPKNSWFFPVNSKLRMIFNEYCLKGLGQDFFVLATILSFSILAIGLIMIRIAPQKHKQLTEKQQ